jgi:hypothetical protein
MIQRKELNSVAVKIYSDCGKKISQVQSNRIYSVAIEKDKHFEYREVEE